MKTGFGFEFLVYDLNSIFSKPAVVMHYLNVFVQFATFSRYSQQANTCSESKFCFFGLALEANSAVKQFI